MASITVQLGFSLDKRLAGFQLGREEREEDLEVTCLERKTMTDGGGGGRGTLDTWQEVGVSQAGH